MAKEITDQTIWKFYTSSEDAWDAMLQAISGAKESIELEQFILRNDEVGIKFIDAFKEKVKQGVKIRILCDEVGSFSLARSSLDTSLLEAGVEIKFFNSVVPWSPNNESLWYFRDHRKLMIVDKRIGFTGGVCLGEEMRNWRESSISIRGPIVDQMIESFEVMWDKQYHTWKYYLPKNFAENFAKKLTEDIPWKKQNKATPSDGKDFQYLTNAPLPGKHYLYRELIRAVRKAKHYIYLTTPYLLPDSRLFKSLKEATRRGVSVRILVPMSTNSILVNVGMGTFFNEMLTHGIEIYRYSKAMIHAKTAVVDGTWSTIGSLNLDNLSLRYNFEGNIVSIDKHFSFELEKQFLEDLKMASKLSLLDWNRRSYFRKFLELLIWPLRKFL